MAAFKSILGHVVIESEAGCECSVWGWDLSWRPPVYQKGTSLYYAEYPPIRFDLLLIIKAGLSLLFQPIVHVFTRIS